MTVVSVAVIVENVPKDHLKFSTLNQDYSSHRGSFLSRISGDKGYFWPV